MEAFQSVQRLLSIVFIFLQAVLLLRTGIYGSLAELGAGNAMLIFIELSMAGVLVLLLDEMLENGYGLGSGISLFIATSTCERIFWSAFSPTTINTGRGIEFEGSIIQLLHAFFSKTFNSRDIFAELQRENLPNLRELVFAVGLALFVAWLQSLHCEIPLQHKTSKRSTTSYPVKLVSTSTFPLILQSQLVSQLLSISRQLHRFYGGNFLVRLLGSWESSERGYKPTGGLAHLLIPITTPTELLENPVRAALYTAIVMSVCAVFSVTWLDFSGSSAKAVGRSLDSQGFLVKGRSRKHTVPILRHYINTSAFLGGALIGLLTVVTDIFGPYGICTGIVLAVNLIMSYYKLYLQHRKHTF